MFENTATSANRKSLKNKISIKQKFLKELKELKRF